MAEKIWHYTVGDDQFGPVSSDELKKLAEAGKLKPDDQVWKEGMGDWKPASDMQGLFADSSTGAPANKEMKIDAPSGPHGRKKMTRQKPLDPLAMLQPYGHAILMVGFLLVVISRGCDSIGNRYVARATAKYSAAQSRFNDDAELQRQKLEDKIEDAQAGEKKTKYREDLKELVDDQKKDRRKLEKGAWRDLKIAGRDAANDNRMGGYWHEILFIIGTMGFVIGLITVGFRGEGSEKTICLVMLAIVTASIFVAGTPWIGSLPGILGR